MGLLDKTTTLDGRRVLFFPWEGREVRVWDDADTALRVIGIFDGDEEPSVKLSELVSRLFVDVGDLGSVSDVNGLLGAVCWECCGLDILGEHNEETGGAKVIDWECDADYIATSLLMCYGVNWDEARYRYSYRQVCSMIGLVAHETPMGQALYYRTGKPPEPTKYNADERRRWREARSFWAIKEKKPDAESVNDKMNAAFAALERMARS